MKNITERIDMKKIVLAGIVGVMILAGCTTCNTEPTVVTKVDVVKEPVPAPVRIPELDCDFSGENMTPTAKLLECLIMHKRVIDFLQSPFYNPLDIWVGDQFDRYMQELENNGTKPLKASDIIK